ncbi:MAG: bifunctional (p)ppGpp synthetase/guanosine-3',5'-bis(diphosphate) 3'-pyrophosphohydrolase [Acholeplasmatales bacterium]|jgi:GTP pyrophosphokinase|nr:bifunctional (p)ppGpp synthetase/guanosine-3',5'-bis(diphosphate) 3'-pyrophosphohydrolase [Acholeplasmatales bacterium]
MNTTDLLDKLISKIKEYISKESDIALITKAFYYSQKAHEGQYRKSGEPYIIHPVAVAAILADLKTGPNTICAALLHDTVEDTNVTLADIRKEFNDDIAVLIDGVTKIGKISYTNDSQNDNHQKMLLAMAKDIRVVVIKIADRLHNMRTLEFMAPEKQVRISKETLDIYAPLAHKLGIFRIKAELEDISLKYTNPEMYQKIAKLVLSTKKTRDINITNIIKKIKILLFENNIRGFEIKGRIKNIYSIYKKMVVNNKEFEDIYDLLAIRIIITSREDEKKEVEECYHALGIIHANFKPIPKRFKDYIAVPKPNLYQSLHTTVLSNDETLFEVQIRTQTMDLVAENGIAAHWAYKESIEYSKEKEQFEIAKALHWYADLLKMSEDEETKDETSKEYVDAIKQDILDANVYVYTPKGLIIELSKGSTPIDFAYKIHTDIGHKMVGAIVNNKIVTLDYELKTGDIVNVKTNKNSVGPSEDWIKMAKTASAKHKIKTFLNQQNMDSIILEGKKLLLDELSSAKITEIPTDDKIKKAFVKTNIQTLSELYFEIGKGVVSPKTATSLLYGTTLDKEFFLNKQMEKTSRILISQSDTGIVIEGLQNPLIKLASCCNPVPGDSITGYITKGQGIVVHAGFCKNLLNLDKKRYIEALWATDITRKYPCWLKIICESRNLILTDVITAINASNVQIAEFNSHNTSTLEMVIKIKATILNATVLEVLFANLKKIQGVYSIERGIN